MKAAAGCGPEKLGLCSVQLLPIGTQPRRDLADVCRHTRQQMLVVMLVV